MHHPALHGSQNEGGQRIQVEALRKPVPRLFQTAPDRAGPGLEVRRDARMRRQIVGFDFQRQPSQRTPVATPGIHQPSAIPRQNGEDPLDRVAPRRKSGLHNDRFQPVQIAVQHRQQEGFLAGKEMVEAPGVGPCPRQNLGDSGSGIAPLPE